MENPAYDAAYYARREEQERALAAKAVDPAIRAIHCAMADKYAELARRGARPAEPPSVVASNTAS
jgi:hypothetical protein